MSVHKIIVGKNEEVTEVAEKIIDAEAEEILLVIPRFSRLKESGANFRLLKREATALKKSLAIESVDEEVVKHAREHGISCHNPFFMEGGRRLADIVTGEPERRRDAHHAMAQGDEKEDPAHVEATMIKKSHHQKKPFRFRTFAWFLGVAAVLAIGLYVLLGVLPRADIKIVAAKTPWTFNGMVLADKTVATPDPNTGKIPGQVFEEKKNFQIQFPASGKKQMERKASGTITIFNAYSGAPQALVAQTRFEAPDGKIFRLAQAVIVPGAAVSSGKIIPASIAAQVVADKPGEAYNISPVSKFTIPGFSGTPKFTRFSAESKTAMAGGFIGVSAYPTDADIIKAKETAAKTLENSIRTIVLAKLPSEFKLIDGASKFKLGTVTVVPDVTSQGQFSVSAEGSLTLVVFRESDLRLMLLQKAKAEGAKNGRFEVKEEKEIIYEKPEFHPNDVLAIPLKYEATLARTIDSTEVRRKVAGKSETDLHSSIFTLFPAVSAKISLWPFWVRRVPSNIDRIHVTID